jgi:long-chain acyl-CoA synthetase
MLAHTSLNLPVRELFAIAERAPHAEALRYKRRGAWLSWSWTDLVARVKRLGQALEARGIGARSLVVVSGEYGPNLVVFALAAARQGSGVVTVPTRGHPQTLAEWLTRNRPDLVFLGLREVLGTWRTALCRAGRTVAIVTDFHLPWGHASDAGFSFVADVLGPAEHGVKLARPSSAVLWIEESTDWADGLSYLLHAAASGRALAFPESRIAAGRDRSEVQPAAIALSSDHHAALSRDLWARLPTGRTLAARLTRLALNAGRQGRTRWYHRRVLARLRRPFGLARLHELTVVGGGGHAASTEEAGDLFVALGISPGYLRSPVEAVLRAEPKIAFA